MDKEIPAEMLDQSVEAKLKRAEELVRLLYSVLRGTRTIDQLHTYFAYERPELFIDYVFITGREEKLRTVMDDMGIGKEDDDSG